MKSAVKLYRDILRLHRHLPTQMRSLGDDYVKAEFRRHQKCEAAYVAPFMQEWVRYRDTLTGQILKERSRTVGTKLSLDKLNKFSNEQIGQLSALRDEIRHLFKPTGQKSGE